MSGSRFEQFEYIGGWEPRWGGTVGLVGRRLRATGRGGKAVLG